MNEPHAFGEEPRPTVVLGLAGDTMLGRLVGERLTRHGPQSLVAPEVVAVAHEADLFVLNLECCISDRGEPWPAPGKRFFFRAPPAAVEVLNTLGVDCVTLANNHALDFGPAALLDTLVHLACAGVAAVGAGPDQVRARAPVALDAKGHQMLVVAVTDHPADFAADANQPGVAWADLHRCVPAWLQSAVEDTAREVAGSGTWGGVVVAPHWGPNMVAEPVPHVRRAARVLRDAGATLVAGHSAHVFHGVEGAVLYDLGDFLDDYATSPLRNDLGLLFLVELDELGPRRLEAVPLELDFCRTRLATGEDVAWVADRFRSACEPFGTEVRVEDHRLVVNWR
jgi:poly-gamma-glutamate synthesis protein (capsule biosynthesis protein)